MNKIMLSIIVPVYNVQDYLRMNLDSLCMQTRKDYEIIAVNDGSTDQSRKILDEYQQKYPMIKVIDQENGGLSAARNTGLQHASGIYIGFIDSDDFVSEEYVETMLLLAEQDNSDMVVCDIEFFWDKKDSRNYVMKGLNPSYNHLPSGKRGIVSPLFAWNKIYRKDFFFQHGILFQPKTWYEDLEVTTFLFAKAKIISYAEKTLIHYRQRENSIMNTRSSRCTEIFNVLKRIHERFTNYQLLDEYKEEICYLFIENLLLYGQFRILALDNFKELNQQSLRMMKKYFPDYRNNFYLKKLSIKNQVFVYLNNQWTCGLFRKYLLRK